ncbi:hypothetical protein JA9_001121 [Meyerozyma sp. JA9]|nr:hypothetical protein JA9_001121 [Meyerozyma sp. JA9]
MAHIQERTEQETRNFFAKLKDSYAARFSSATSVIQKEADGDSEDDTLIHRAFVKYFDSIHQPYPEWLGEKRQRPSANSYQSRAYQGQQQQMQTNSRPRSYQEQLQPVRVDDDYSNQPPFQRGNSWSQGRSQHQETQSAPARTYTRSSSRLQDMYNRSREQSVPGAGYSSSSYQPARTNSASGGSSSRLRDKMLSNHTPPPSSGSQSAPPTRATWGRK